MHVFTQKIKIFFAQYQSVPICIVFTHHPWYLLLSVISFFTQCALLFNLQQLTDSDSEGLSSDSLKQSRSAGPSSTIKPIKEGYLVKKGAVSRVTFDYPLSFWRK